MADRSTEGLEQRLRRALADEAASVRPGEGWTAIRTAIDDRPARRARWSPRVWVPLAAAASVLAMALLASNVLDLTGRSGGDAAAPAEVVGPGPLPVYYVTRQNDRWALVREFQATGLTDAGDRLQSALDRAVAGRASDPDYTSVWRDLGLASASRPSGGLVSATVGEAQIEVRVDVALVGAADARADAATAELARLAVDQLVWTATGVVGRNVPVTVNVVSGEADRDDRLFGLVDLGAPFQREGPDADPRAPIWVNSVTDGERLRAGTAFTVTGDADLAVPAAPDVPPQWQVQRDGEAADVVAWGDLAVVDTRTPPARSSWEADLPPLPAGGYLLSVTYRGWTETKRLDVVP